MREFDDAALESITEEMSAALPSSLVSFRNAASVIPGGSTRSRFWWPVPVYINSGAGAYVTDVDGKEYVDCNLAFGPLILGHHHPVVTQAMHDQLDRGVIFGAPNRMEAELGTLIVENTPGAEKVVFTSTGSEATLGALKLARAATGRSKVGKFEGGWHGVHDLLCHSFRTLGGSVSHPETLPASAGISDAVRDTVVALPYNNSAALDRITEEADDLACVIVETNQASGGAISADKEFLGEVRELCAKLGIVFIVDEVITGFRMGPSGGSGQYDLVPDLVTLGKIMGGGISAGAIAGSQRLLDLASPGSKGMSVSLGGTHSANPLAMVAGRETLNVLLETPVSTYGRLDEIGERVRTGLRNIISELGIAAQITGSGSLWGMHFLEKSPHNMRDQLNANAVAGQLLAAYLLLEGVLISAPIHLAFLSTAHTDPDIDKIIDAHRVSLVRLKSEGWLS